MRTWKWRRWIGLCLVVWCSPGLADVRLERVPENGLQPDVAREDSGRIHLVYLAGDPGAADVRHVQRDGPGRPWTTPRRVNSQAGSAIAVGSVRGARLALGISNRVHVVWNGSARAEPRQAGSAPLLYARSDDAGSGFELQRNLGGEIRHLDGGAAVASDGRGTVLVAWHGALPRVGPGPDDESGRGVYVARSEDDGKTFDAPRRIDVPGTGVCACCALEARFTGPGRIQVLYRRATGGTQRGMALLSSGDGGRTFASRFLDEWEANQCPMTTARLLPGPGDGLAVWSSRGEIRLARVGFDPSTDGGSRRVSPAGARANHPVVAGRPGREMLVAWTEGTGWQKGGAVGWQVLDAAGEPKGQPEQRTGVPVWGSVAAWAESNGDYTVLY